MKTFGTAALALAALALSACQPVNPRISTLWTNVPEIPGYVENFNASQTQWQILIHYKADPALELMTPGIKADLVISRNLDSRTLKSKWTSMSFLFERGGVSKSDFYPELLNLGSDGGTPLLLPLSFDLPIIVFKKGSLSDPDGRYFSLNFLKNASQHFDDTTPIGFHRFAFSPRWNGFAEIALTALGVPFGEDFRGRLGWDAGRLTSALTELKTWVMGKDQGQEERDFTQKYASSNPVQLIEEGRELFAATTLKTFLKLPDDERKGLEFRYPNAGRGVPVEDDIVWAGIPSSAQTRSAAQAFLLWYFQQKTQASLVRYSHDEYLRGFGIADGLDSLESVNTSLLPLYYPDLTGRIPQASSLIFPEPLPSEWPNLQSTVIDPWLNKYLEGVSAGSLDELVDRWYRETSPH